MTKFFDFGVELYFSDLSTFDHVTLHTYDVATRTTKSHPLPRLCPLRAQSSSQGLVITATIRTPRLAPSSSGSWSLVAQFGTESKLEFQEIDTNVPRESLTSHFGASYEPNKHLCMFRDVLEIPPESLPIYINFNVKYAKNEDCRLPINFHIFQVVSKSFSPSETKQTQPTLRLLESRVGLGSVCIPCFWPRLPNVSEASPPKTLFVLEAELESGMIQVDEPLRSSCPYKHSRDMLSQSTRKNASHESIKWFLSLYSATEGSQLTHYAEAKTERQILQRDWECNEPGRAERAKLSRAQSLGSKCFTNVLWEKSTPASALKFRPRDSDAAHHVLACGEKDAAARSAEGRAHKRKLQMWRKSYITDTVGFLHAREGHRVVRWSKGELIAKL